VADRFVPVSRPEYCFTNRQSLPEVYRPNGAVYVFSADWFLINGGLATHSIGALVMPPEQSQDIDTEADFRLAEALFSAPSSERAGASGDRAP
jgi:CMP-N,N'-diacetyllegionaminic acid synthase